MTDQNEKQSEIAQSRNEAEPVLNERRKRPDSISLAIKSLSNTNTGGYITPRDRRSIHTELPSPTGLTQPQLKTNGVGVSSLLNRIK